MIHVLDPAATVAAILAGEVPASAAMGRRDLFPLLTRGANGATLPLLGTSAKIDAGTGVGVLTRVLYMMPANESGRESCAHRSAGCSAACLAEGTGRMSMSGPRIARRRRHAAFYADRPAFLAMLAREIRRHARAARKAGKIAAIRLNGTTDLPFHRMPVVIDGERFPSLHVAFPAVRFYEYTKHPLSLARKGGLPANLSLTFSASDHPDSEERAGEYLAAGLNVAAVLRIARHEPPAWHAIGGVLAPCIDGDAHDARFLDPSGVIVALAAKGRAKYDSTGFVRNP